MCFFVGSLYDPWSMNDDTAPVLEDRLKALFGYNEFRAHQKGIVSALLDQKDVLAILPTGAGKSICYQLPALLLPGTAVVISPLISLMQDQVMSLSKNALSAAFLNSSLSYAEITELMRDLHRYKMLYVAPERFADKRFVERLKEMTISLFAIDEAHCISQWGHSFRPDYRQLAFLKTMFPMSRIIALTATATHEVQRDIIAQLAMNNPYLVRASFDRPNLTLRIYPRKKAAQQLRKFLEKHAHQSGIIYAATRKKVDELYDEVVALGIQAGKYHAGMSDQERTEAQHEFIHGKMPLMIATVAFGMGIHKPDIRFIVHVDMPRSIEQYYQEIGRAGRDSLSAECMLLYSYQEVKIYELFAEQIADFGVRRQTELKTRKMLAFCQSNMCRRKQLLSYFGEAYPKDSCEGCDQCLDDADLIDKSIEAQKILSCVYRLRYQHTANYVIDVLRGVETKEILEKGHDRLSTYGLMKESTGSELSFLVRNLIRLGHLEEAPPPESVLRWTETAQPVIKGLVKVMIRKVTRQNARKADPQMPNYDTELFDALSRLRRSFAEEKKVPAFVVFGDKTLMEMAALLPSTREELMKINGVGPIKWNSYGPKFLELIHQYRLAKK